MSARDNTINDVISTDRDIRSICSILESIARHYAPDSQEAKALHDAAIAHSIVQNHRVLKKKYNEMLDILGGTIPKEVEAQLRRCGIDPDDLDNDAMEDAGLRNESDSEG